MNRFPDAVFGRNEKGDINDDVINSSVATLTTNAQDRMSTMTTYVTMTKLTTESSVRIQSNWTLE